jgi:hypothetical protein
MIEVMLVVPVPFADQPGDWTLSIGGPSRQSDITSLDVRLNGNVNKTSSDASQSFSWSSGSGDSGTTLEFRLKPDLGIEIFDMTLTGNV